MAMTNFKLRASEAAFLATKVADGMSVVTAAQEVGVSLRTAFRYLREERMNKVPPKSRPPCGTNAGYASHIAHKEIADDACLQAHATEQRQWKKRKKEKEKDVYD